MHMVGADHGATNQRSKSQNATQASASARWRRGITTRVSSRKGACQSKAMNHISKIWRRGSTPRARAVAGLAGPKKPGSNEPSANVLRRRSASDLRSKRPNARARVRHEQPNREFEREQAGYRWPFASASSGHHALEITWGWPASGKVDLWLHKDRLLPYAPPITDGRLRHSQEWALRNGALRRRALVPSVFGLPRRNRGARYTGA